MPTNDVFALELDVDTLIVIPLRDLGSFVGDEVGTELAGALEHLGRPAVKHVIVDLREISYFGSTMLGAINKLWKTAGQSGGRLAICNADARQREILGVTKLDTVWPIHESRAESLRFVRQ